MHLAVSSPNTVKPINLIKRLLIKGADLTVVDKKGRSPIDSAKKRVKKDASFSGLLHCLERALSKN